MRVLVNVHFFLYIFLANHCHSGVGVLELEQSGVLYVCLGGALNVKCSTSADKLEWNVTIPYYEKLWSRTLSYIGTAEMATPITDSMNTTVNLHISRSLNETLALPLISILSTRTVTVELNKTVIICTGKTLRDNTVLGSASVQVILIGDNDGNVNTTPSVNITEQLGLDRITVNLEWIHKNGVSYNVSVDPQVAVNYTGRNRVQLIVFYDKIYNISVVASLCGRNSTIFRVLNHVTCLQLETDSSVQSVAGLDSRHPAVEGTVATLACPPDKVLIGPNNTTCMGNREWEPNPKRARCKVDCHAPMANANNNVSLNYTSTLEDSLLTFQCEDGLFPGDVFTARCYRNGSWIPNPLNHVCVTSLAANCSDPSPPSDGYLEPYTSTSVGARVNIVHMCGNGLMYKEEVICTLGREWETIHGSGCVISDPSPQYYIIGGSLGSFFGVTVLSFIIIVSIAAIRKKGSLPVQRNKSVSRNSGNERTGDDYQGEYSLLQHSIQRPGDGSAGLKGDYSLLQKYDIKEDDQQNSKDQSTALVYADVIPFKQRSHVSTLDGRVEYAQLKEHSDKLPTHLTASSLDMKTHPADQAINLDTLLIQLKSAVTDKWYQFGEAIGVNKELLNKYSQYPPEQNLVEILDDWLRNHSGQPSWNEIAEALEEIGLQQLAFDIKNVYETGKLPIEVDMDGIGIQPLSHHPSEELPPPIPPRQF